MILLLRKGVQLAISLQRRMARIMSANGVDKVRLNVYMHIWILSCATYPPA